MNKQRTAVLVIASLGVLATFMPWASVPVLGSMNGTQNTLGIVSLILFSIPLIVSLIGNKTKELKGGLLYAAIIAAVTAAMTDVFQIVVFKMGGSRAKDPFEILIAQTMKIDFGIYIAILAGIALPLFALLMRDVKRTVSDTIHKMPVQHTWYEEENTEAETANNKTEEDIEIDKEDHSRFMPK